QGVWTTNLEPVLRTGVSSACRVTRGARLVRRPVSSQDVDSSDADEAGEVAGPAASDLAAVGDRRGDLGDGLVHGDPVLLRPVAVAEGHRTGGAVVRPRDEHVGHLGLARVADLLREAVV